MDQSPAASAPLTPAPAATPMDQETGAAEISGQAAMETEEEEEQHDRCKPRPGETIGRCKQRCPVCKRMKKEEAKAAKTLNVTIGGNTYERIEMRNGEYVLGGR